MKAMRLKSEIKVERCATLLMTCALVLLLTCAQGSVAAPARSSDEAEVRAVVQSVFDQLRSGRYSDLYDLLPNASRARIPRERFTSMLERTRNMYQLERMDIGNVRTSGDLAVVDTVFYGRVLQPIQSEGKIVAQQYLVREDGRWRVATGDRATVKRFLASNPRFAQNFPLRQPRVYIKREGRWVDVTSLAASTRRARQ